MSNASLVSASPDGPINGFVGCLRCATAEAISAPLISGSWLRAVDTWMDALKLPSE